MKRLLGYSTICIVILVLTGCGFPSQRLMRIVDCGPDNTCGAGIISGSELALVKESRGGGWRLWHKLPSEVMDEICKGAVNNDKFKCPQSCNTDKTITVEDVNASDCGFDQCMQITVEGGNGCPNGGQGTGGNN